MGVARRGVGGCRTSEMAPMAADTNTTTSYTDSGLTNGCRETGRNHDYSVYHGCRGRRVRDGDVVAASREAERNNTSHQNITVSLQHSYAP